LGHQQLEQWSFPIALLSYHSAFLKAACTRDFKEREDNCIKLPTDDSAIFSLFVEWMIYGRYITPTATGSANPNAEAWVLGDKLMAPAFKDYAMSKLYLWHSTSKLFNPTIVAPVAAKDVAYACAHTTLGSTLRQFYLDFAATYFSDPDRVSSPIEDWDEVILEHEDARIFFLHALRAVPGQRKFLKDVGEYMEKDALRTGTLGNIEDAS
jgi:hypothetical protein